MWTLPGHACARHTVVMLALALVTLSTKAAAVPTTMTYQGRLTGPDGMIPRTGDFNMEFRIFADPTGGAALWEERFNNQYRGPVPVDRLGLFEVLLGDSISLTPSLFPSDSARYLEIEVNGEVLSPRKPLNSLPYAFTSAGTAELWQTDGTNVYRTTGNVGIGVTAPSAKLDVAGPQIISAFGQYPLGAEGLQLTYDPAPGLGSLVASVVSTQNKTLNLGGQKVIFSTNPTSGNVADGISNVRMTLDPSGNVGVGTTNPSEKLQVAGLVHSTTGGFRFPDGTVQTTAAQPPLLRTYDSGWFPVGSSETHAFAHNLGTTKVICQLYGATDASGSNMSIAWAAWEGLDGQTKHSFIGQITPTTCVVRTGIHAPCACWNGSGWQAATYMRVIAVALE